MKRKVVAILLALFSVSFCFSEKWTSPQEQVFTFTNETSISIKDGSLESLAAHFYKWKNAKIVLAISNRGVPTCICEIESAEYSLYDSDDYVPFLRTWLANKISDEKQLGEFLNSGFYVSSTHKLPNGTITQYGALRLSGYVKFDNELIIKAGNYSGNFDEQVSTVPQASQNSCNAAYLYLYVTGNYEKIDYLPVPSGLDDSFKKAFRSLPSNIENRKWNEVAKAIEKYNISDKYFLPVDTLIVPTLFEKLVEFDAPLEVWKTFNSFSSNCFSSASKYIKDFNTESLYYICSKLKTEDLKDVLSALKDSQEKIDAILEKRDDNTAKGFSPFFHNYTTFEELESQRLALGMGDDEFYLCRTKLDDGNFLPSILEKLCLENKSDILDRLFEKKIKCAIVYSDEVYSLEWIRLGGEPSSEFGCTISFFCDKPNWSRMKNYSLKHKTFVEWGTNDGYVKHPLEKLPENNYIEKLYIDSLFRINYFFASNDDFNFYSMKSSEMTQIDVNLYMMIASLHNVSIGELKDTYPEWCKMMYTAIHELTQESKGEHYDWFKIQDGKYICNLEFRNSNNDTLLMYAIQKGNKKFAAKLLKQNIDINAVNNDGKNALDIAIEIGDKKTEKALRKLMKK